MLEGKAVVGETDMLQKMQQDALHLAAEALDSFDVTEPTEIARFIKKIGSLAILLFRGSAGPENPAADKDHDFAVKS
ncbi:unnamed protein product [Linum tenue]|uniref:Dynein light chain n=1 Tax=Linum tenue TaxID=586396 RepID=A0AAV0GSY2_9ROSI|nr:unnamed protein product [Linum tenue]